MKNLLLIVLSIAVIGFMGCESGDLNLDKTVTEKSELRSNIEFDTFTRKGEVYMQGEITVTCTNNPCEGNNIGPYDHCQVRFDVNGHYECTCSGCKMTVISNVVSSNFDVWSQIYREDLHMDEAIEYIESKYNEQLSSFNKVLFNFQPNATSIIYFFELNNGTIETIMYVNTYDDAGAPGKKYEIDCTGECECREQFDFNSNTAQCSCSPCQLEVTVTDVAGSE